tara:strand:+ start:3802 stop:3987 length:186 start_codon:yes stop_codon:yes gene_type:complete
MEKFPYNIKGTTGVSQILKPFVKRGIIFSTTEPSSQLKVYRWTDDEKHKPGNVLLKRFVKV